MKGYCLQHPILAEQLRLMVSDNPDERPTVVLVFSEA
ncbi:BnaC04g22310D [Brassica napus]|uniref:BnaC04g22310D protein n=1 Tax=Brassica napus TaxID=3708 RepID=A0A078HW33_BRANA|nr:BnaC04g22310D [Brassica napus]